MRECGKKKWRTNVVYTVCEYHTRFSLFSMLDIAFFFKRDARKMTQQIISSLVIVAFFYSFLPFFRAGLDQVYPRSEGGLWYFYLRPPSSLSTPPPPFSLSPPSFRLPLQVFSCCTGGGVMKQAYSLYFLQRSPSRSVKDVWIFSTLIIPGFFALSREGERAFSD